MKGTLLVPVLLIASGCNQSNNQVTSAATASSGWTDSDRASVQLSCEKAALRSSGVKQEYATAYCHCLFESITARWSYSELLQKEVSINEALAKEGTSAACLQAAGKLQSEKLSQTARAAGMPDGFFGVQLNSSIDDARAARPGLVESSGHLEEVIEWNGKAYRVSYAVNPFSKQVFFISLERPSDKVLYVANNEYLSSEHGQFSPPAPDGPWLLSSERAAGGVKLTHVLSDEGAGAMKEQIMLSIADN